MGKLHELIAVGKDAKTVSIKVIQEAIRTFTSRAQHFDCERRVYAAFTEGDKDIPEQQHIPMVTTVKDKLDYVIEKIITAIDISYQKERTNTKAKGDIIAIGKDDKEVSIAINVPVVVLVQLEGEIALIRQMYSAIPTLDPSKVWKKSNTDTNIYLAPDQKTIRSKKEPRPLTLAAATDKFKAQVEVIHTDVPVGEFIKSFESSKLTPEEKSTLLERIDNILAAVKKARARANETVAENAKIGREIFKYIHG